MCLSRCLHTEPGRSNARVKALRVQTIVCFEDKEHVTPFPNPLFPKRAFAFSSRSHSTFIHFSLLWHWLRKFATMLCVIPQHAPFRFHVLLSHSVLWVCEGLEFTARSHRTPLERSFGNEVPSYYKITNLGHLPLAFLSPYR